MSLELQSAVESDNKVIERSQTGKDFVPVDVEEQEESNVIDNTVEETPQSENDEVNIDDL